ncbi:MAG: glycyl-radical enzyme activating protein [Oscillospiraceae bacterium]|nr:glycyl-radical enzyme activating protein [Oscillospiraceae bacterium]
MDYQNVPGRVFDLQGYSVHDGPGIRTTVYLKGCPLRCVWCHSPESLKYSIELVYLPIKCIGVKLCESACIKSCPQGAISEGVAEEAMDKSGMICKAVVDRSQCTGCLACTSACITKALSPAAWDTDVDEICARLLKDRPFFKRGGGVSICGGEALAQFDFTYNLAKRLHECAIHVCLDTTGYTNLENIKAIAPFINLYLYDLKHMNPEMHKRLTGVSNEKILENARYLAKNGGKFYIRIPIIPGLTDDEDNLSKTAEFCKELGNAVELVQLLPFHEVGKVKYERIGLEYQLSSISPPDDDFMNKTLALFKSYGLHVQLN